MTDQQRQWFNEFVATKRQEIQGIDRGGDNRIWKFISDHYSDKAHFLYELIQNADDAGATKATFELSPDAVEALGRGRLVFRHNGTKHFTITRAAPNNSADYENARRDGTLDSVYSICTVGNSTKEVNDIGKFGIGFKSVFLYTNSPRIYDDGGVRFEITDFVVPNLLTEDFEGRETGQTVFVFPFNRTEGDHLPQNPSEDILRKLRSLILPTLFLRNLKTVSWISGTMSGEYSTTRRLLFDATDNSNSHICEVLAKRRDGDEESREEFILVNRSVEPESALEWTVGFKRVDGKLVPADYAPFCYFPTQVSFGLKFIVNAPFILTSTRESLDFSNDESIRTNQTMMDGLSSLLADSLLYLRDLGREKPDHRYLSETIFKILPLSTAFVPPNELKRLNILRNDDPNNYFNGFYSKPLKKFQNEEIIPCSKKEGGYCHSSHAYFARAKSIVDSFDDEDLEPVAQYLKKTVTDDLHWVYSQTYDYHESERGCEANEYIAEIGATGVYSRTVVQAVVNRRYIEEKINDQQWLLNFYNWLADQPDKTMGRELALLLNQHSNPTPAAANNAPNLFLPDDNFRELCEQEGISVVRQDLHQWDCVRALESAWGVVRWDPNAHAMRLISMVKLSTTSDDEREQATVKLMKILADGENVTEATKNEAESALWQYGRLKAKNGKCRPLNELYCDSDKWSDFKEIVQNSGCLFVDINQYGQKLGTEAFKDVLSRIGIDDKPFLLETDWILLKDVNGNWIKNSDVQFERSAIRDSTIRNHLDYLSAVGVGLSPRSLRYKKIVMPALDMLLEAPNGGREFLKRRENAILKILLAVASNEQPLKCASRIGRNPLDFMGEYGGIKSNGQANADGTVRNQENAICTKFDSLVLQRLKTSKWIVGDEGGPYSPSEVTDAVLDPAVRNNPSFELVRGWLGIRIGTNGGTGKSDKPMPVCLPLSNELKNGLALLQEAVSDSSSPPPRFPDKPEVLNIRSYLSLNLCIPRYQRPYEWNERNVVELLDDICEAAQRKETKYRIGSIILHVEDGVYNIVDGQQRTLTLLLVLCRLMSGGGGISDGDGNAYLQLLSSGEFYPALSQCKTSRRNLRNNLVHIDEYFRMHPGSDEAVLEALKSQLEVVVIPVKEQSEAFQLFDSQNSKGRPLEPHDLLKAFHLRLVPDKQEPADKVKTKTEMVEEWEAHDSSEIGRLFETLFRICKWNRKEKCHRFTAQDIGVFKGVPVQAGVDGKKPEPKPYGYVTRAVESKQCFQIGEPFVPGGDFFAMVEHYFKLRESIDGISEKEKLGECSKKHGPVGRARSHCRSKYLEPLFDAVLLDYFDRFGLETVAGPELAIRKLCKWAFSVRLDVEYLGPKTPNKYALGNGTQSEYSNPIPMFFRIKTAVEPTEVTSIRLVTPPQRDNDFELWKALEEL